MSTPQQIAHQIGALGDSMATSIQPNVSAAKHEHIIEAIAKETDVSIERVREIYETERSRLDADARVKTYVSVIATRLVKNALQPKQ
jgi:predicted phosphoribosyltransferase